MFRPGNPYCGTDDGTEAGQPRPVEGARDRPSAAERVRTLVESSVTATLGIPGAGEEPATLPGGAGPLARAVTPGGEVILLVTAAHPAARAAVHARDDDLPAVLEITDVAPVAVPHRVRGRAWVVGWLTAVRGAEWDTCARLLGESDPAAPAPGDGRVLLRLEVGEAQVDDLWGASGVEPDEFAAASGDPLAAHEAELLQHLAAAHGDRVGDLCALLGPGAGPGGASPAGHAARGRVVPLSLDRFGLRVRLCGAWGHRDAWFAFGEPVRDVAELRRAMHRLFEAAATAGRSGRPMRAPGRGQP